MHERASSCISILECPLKEAHSLYVTLVQAYCEERSLRMPLSQDSLVRGPWVGTKTFLRDPGSLWGPDVKGKLRQVFHMGSARLALVPWVVDDASALVPQKEDEFIVPTTSDICLTARNQIA